MFFKRILVLNILKAASNNKAFYKSKIKSLIKEYGDEIDDEMLFSISLEYLKKVYDDVTSLYDDDMYMKILEVERNPSISGYELNLNNGFLGGTIYAIIFYAKKGKPARPSECTELNHRVNEIMHEVLIELDNEL